ncbi:MAG: ferritin family protein [Deltaproteobacteria bacterium]|nr:ferritin family protein [Deltaproteobacteria bacterium]
MTHVKQRTLAEVFELAIEREQSAVDFYTSLAESSENPAMARAFEDLAKEELGHKARLQKALQRGGGMRQVMMPMDLKITEFVMPTVPVETMNYEDAIVMAMHREQAAFQLYSDLSEMMTDATLAFLFRSLAAEEARHRHRFELEYDEHVLDQN